VPAAASKPAASAQRVVLVITGKGKPVAQADVQLRAAGKPDLNSFTDKDGVASFVPTAPRYTVRVIARGWVTFEKDYALPGGTRTEIQLSAKQHP
jgi:hypothetical protein